MPSLSRYKEKLKQDDCIGVNHKDNSDMIMEYSWNRDHRSKKCYIYDYQHDDHPDLNKKIPHDDANTKKYKIDAKFITITHQTTNKDTVDYKIQFRPSQKMNFEENDELYYYETDYRQRWDSMFPVGLYIDIPNEENEYERWLIVGYEFQNQFPKFLILPCTYRYSWIEEQNNKRIKRQMWGTQRSLNSYNNGLWEDYTFTLPENVEKAMLPMNEITEYLYYTHPVTKKNQRMIVSALTKKPIVWNLSKIENHSPMGIVKITLSQDKFDVVTDYVNLDTKEMYADYYYNDVSPDVEKTAQITIKTETPDIVISSGYKKLELLVLDDQGHDITTDYLSEVQIWKAYVDGKELISTNYDVVYGVITWKYYDFNVARLKANIDDSYIGKIMTIKVFSNDNTLLSELNLNIIA